MTTTPFATPKRIILEDTGERRFPQGNEIYVCLSPTSGLGSVVTAHGLAYKPRPEVDLADRISCADDYDDEWFGKPEDFAIYRIVEAE